MRKLNETKVRPLDIRLPVGIDAEKNGADQLIPYYKFEPYHYCMSFPGSAVLTSEAVDVTEGGEIESNVSLQGKTVFLAAPSAEKNYFHWLVDVIGRLGIINDRESIENIVINSGGSGYQARSLEYLGLNSRFVEVGYGQTVSSGEMLVPSLRRTGNHAPPKWAVDFIRNTFLPKISALPTSAARIFISRRGAKVRKIVNEDEVEGILSRNGFSILRMEDYTLEEQISLSSQADVILGPHGAGLTNSVFCKPNATLVEIFAPQYVGGLFYYLSSHAGARYLYLIGRRQANIESHNENSYDIYVDPQELRTLLEWL